MKQIIWMIDSFKNKSTNISENNQLETNNDLDDTLSDHELNQTFS